MQPPLESGKNAFPVVMLTGLVFGLCFITLQIIGFNFSYFPGDLADARLNLYFLEHAHKFFTGQISGYWDAPFMYPEENIITYSDNLLGSSPIYSFFRLFGVSSYHAFQGWYIVVTALNYYCAYCFLNYVFKNRYSAVLGAFVFAFSLALHSQLTHAQTFPRFAIPLAFLMAVKFSENPNPKYFFAGLFFLVWQIYCGIYLGFMLAVPLALFFLLILIREGLKRNPILFKSKRLGLMLAAIAVNLALLAPLMLPYANNKIPPSPEHYHTVLDTLPTLSSYLNAKDGSPFWSFLSGKEILLPNAWNHQLFAGGIALACAVLAIVLAILFAKGSRSPYRAMSSTPFLLIVTGLITFILFLRFGENSAYAIIYRIPGFSSMRSMTRIINIELLFFAVATCWVFARILNAVVRHKTAIFIITLFALSADNFLYAEDSYRTRLDVVEARTDRLESVFSRIPAGSVVSYEPEAPDVNVIYDQIDAMLLTQKYGQKAINGYTAKSPENYWMYWIEPAEFSRWRWLKLHDEPVDSIYVVSAVDGFRKVGADPEYVPQIENSSKVLKGMVDYIRSDENWMREIERKALEINAPIDSILVEDAIWVLQTSEE